MDPKTNDRFLEERLEKYDKWLEAGEISYASRVVPVRGSIQAQQQVMSSAQALEILRSAKTIALNNCVCRSHYRRCNHPLDVCFLVDEVAVKNVEKDKAWYVSLDAAQDVLNTAKERGLVHLTFYMPGNKIYAFCSCCECCCHDLQLMKLYHRSDLIARSGYFAVTDMEACTHCGECIDCCFFDARVWKEEKMYYNSEACYGCGLCVNACPQEATQLNDNER